MSTVGEVLSRHRVGLTDKDVADELDAAFVAASDPGAAPLSAQEIEYLHKHGGPIAAVLQDRHPAEARAEQGRVIARRIADTVASSVSIDQAATLLNVDRSRVSHLLKQRGLWGFNLGSARRIPRWQITADGQRLPGLDRIVPAIPAAVHPLAVDAFMHTPQAELDGQTPGVFLASGGDADVVADLLRDLGQW